MPSKNPFIDLDLNFLPNYVDGDVTVKLNEEAVKRSLRNLILLRRFEKPFQGKSKITWEVQVIYVLKYSIWN